MEKHLSTVFEPESVRILPMYQGYLVAGFVVQPHTSLWNRFFKKPVENALLICWIHRLNIEGLTSTFTSIAIDNAFQTLFSFLPGGSLAYSIIKDQIGRPPRQFVVFLPFIHEITYGTIEFTRDGKISNVVDTTKNLVQPVIDPLANISKKIGSTLLSPITKKADRKNTEATTKYNFTYIRFTDIFKKSLLNDLKRQSSLIPANIKKQLIGIPSFEFKTLKNDYAAEWLEFVQQHGFQTRYEPLKVPL